MPICYRDVRPDDGSYVYRTARRYERYATDLDGIFIVFFSYDAAFNPSSRETLGGYSMLSRLCI